MHLINADSTSQSRDIFIQDSTSTAGAGKTGLAFNTAGLTAYYRRGNGSPTAITLATLANAQAAWSSGGFVEIDATNQPGMYRLDIPDAVLATGVEFAQILLKGATGMAPVPIGIQLLDPAPEVTLADDAITAAKIATGAFTAAKFASDAWDALVAKLRKYFQLLARKDAAIATDNATELTELNVDGGSGAGAYDNTSEALEALRDRGDAAWITATGFATQASADADHDATQAAIAAAQDVLDLLEPFVDGSAFLPVDAHKQNFSVTGTDLTTYAPDGTTPTAYSPKTVTTDPSAEPITGAS